MELQDKRVAVLVANGYEDSELARPLEALEEAGADSMIISLEEGKIVGKSKSEIAVDMAVKDASSEEFDALLLPGGVANPDALRMHPAAVTFTKDFFDQHKPVAAICHAPWLLIEADVVEGRTVTSWPSLKTDLTNAGAHWVDEEVVVDQGLVTSRNPDDLPAFCAKMVEEFAEGRHSGQVA